MKKRILSLIMAVIMILGVFPVSAFAEEAQECNHNYVNGKCEICDELDPEAPKSRFTVSASKETVNKGETFTVTVSLDETISKSEDITNVQGELYYDSSVLTYVSHELGEAYYDDYVEGHNAANERVQFSRTSMTAKPFEVPAGMMLTVTFKAAEEMSESHIKSALRLRSKLVTSTTVTTTANAYDFVLVVNEHVWEEGICTGCGAECAHEEYENGKCIVCGKAEPVVVTETVIYEQAGDLYIPDRYGYIETVTIKDASFVSVDDKNTSPKVYLDKEIKSEADLPELFFKPDYEEYKYTADIETTIADGKAIQEITITVIDEEWGDTYGPAKMTITFYGKNCLVINKESAELSVNETVDLDATLTPYKTAPANVEWTSSNEAVATVDANGVVTAVAAGSATITAKAEGQEVSAKIIVFGEAIPFTHEKWTSHVTGIVIGGIDASSNSGIITGDENRPGFYNMQTLTVDVTEEDANETVIVKFVLTDSAKVPATLKKAHEVKLVDGKGTLYLSGLAIGPTLGGFYGEITINFQPHEHDWNETTYSWAENGTNCTASRVCKTDETHVEYAPATVTSAVEKDATCSVMGDTKYTATFGVDWAKTQTKTITDIEIDADAHDWDEGKVTTEPTCSEVGVKTFTCKHNAEHTYTEDVAIDADAHAWTVSYVWSKDGKSCTATRVCGNSAEHNVTAEATVTATVAKKATCSAMGDTQYKAVFSADWAETQYTVRTDIAIDKNAHEWGEWKVVTEPDYVNEGLEKRVCKLSDEHFEEKAIEKLIPTATEKTEGPDDTKEYVVAYQEGVVMVPAGLENEYPNQQAVKDALKAKVENGDLKGEVNLVFREVTVGYYENGAFVPVSNGEFFENGKTIEILLKYPEGADKNDKFEVYHLRDDGVIEKCVIKDKTDKGLVIEVGSLSPFVIAYESVNNTPSWPSNPGKPSKPSKPSDKPNPGITIITPEDEKEEANPNTGAPVICSFDLTAAGVVVLAATAAVLEIKRRK